MIELTETAKAEVDSIREIARSLTQTAASAARVALEVCRYSSCQEAFERHSIHCCRLMDLESFLEVVSNKTSYPIDKVDVNAETARDFARTKDCLTTAAVVNDDDAVSMAKSERVGEEAPGDCWKEHVDQRHPVFPQNSHNCPSNPDLRSCCFSCM